MEKSSSVRLQSIDLLRGAVMIIMALDHTRDFVHMYAAAFRPEDLARTTPVLFLTRWITHFCAPVFMFTAGLGAFLRSRKGPVAQFLLTRGLWLILLELTVLRFAFQFDVVHGPVLLTVLWALGWSMVALAALVYLPERVLAIVSIAMIVLHNLFDGVRLDSWVWKFLHQQGIANAGGVTIVFAYPLIPWIGAMAAGYCLGRLMGERRVLLRLGVGLTLAFVVVRAVNIYGDPSPWSAQKWPVLSFLNCTKQPPSLDFLLMTLGPAIIALSLLDGVRVGPRNPVLVFGRVPLFYFLMHMFVIHVLAIGLALIRYGRAGFLLHAMPGSAVPPNLFPPDYGYGFAATYVVWLTVVVLLYPMCVWFAELKQRRRWWLAYF